MITDSWIGWAVAVIVGLPLLVLLLTEVHLRLVRSDNALARPVNLLRVFLLPAVGLLILLTKGAEIASASTGVRTVATIVGVLTIVVALGALNAALFRNAEAGSWRSRLPDIFLDLARLVLIVAGGAVVASYVWGLDVGGLWATLGVGSVVLGLALQGAVGGVVSGLLVLFGQPFTLGDTLTVDGATGKVVEVTWRSTHLAVGSEILVVPNASLAGASFSNRSRPTPTYDQKIPTTFRLEDNPRDVIDTLLAVAGAVPGQRAGAVPSVALDGGVDADGDYGFTYTTTIPLADLADSEKACSVFHTWLWYACRRHGLGLGGVAVPPMPPAQVEAALVRVRQTLDLQPEEAAALVDECRLLTYGTGENLTRVGTAPGAVRLLLDGRIGLTLPGGAAAGVKVAELESGDLITPEALLRGTSKLLATALTDVDVLEVPLEVADRLVAAKSYLARTLSELVTIRRQQTVEAEASLARLDAVPTDVRPADEVELLTRLRRTADLVGSD